MICAVKCIYVPMRRLVDRAVTLLDKQCLVKLLQLLGRGDWSALLRETRKAPFCPPCPTCKCKAKKHRSHETHGYDYRCLRRTCSKVFNAWTGSVFEGTHRSPRDLAALIFGFLYQISPSRFHKDLRWHKTSVSLTLKRLQGQTGLGKLKEGGTVNGVGMNEIAQFVPDSLRVKWLEIATERIRPDSAGE
jgi:hypothetical protein